MSVIFRPTAPREANSWQIVDRYGRVLNERAMLPGETKAEAQARAERTFAVFLFGPVTVHAVWRGPATETPVDTVGT